MSISYSVFNMSIYIYSIAITKYLFIWITKMECLNQTHMYWVLHTWKSIIIRLVFQKKKLYLFLSINIITQNMYVYRIYSFYKYYVEYNNKRGDSLPYFVFIFISIGIAYRVLGTATLWPWSFCLESLVLFTIFKTSYNCGALRERRLSIEFGIGVWVKSNIFMLNMQIWR